MWQLVYRPGQLADVAAREGRGLAIRGFLCGTGLPSLVYFTFMSAGIAVYSGIEFDARLITRVTGILSVALINAAGTIGAPLLLLWVLALKKPHTAVLARVLLLSPLTVFSLLLVCSVLGGIGTFGSYLEHRSVTVGGAPDWMRSPIVVWGGSLEALAIIGGAWAVIASVGIWRLARLGQLDRLSANETAAPKPVDRDAGNRQKGVAVWQLPYRPDKLAAAAASRTPSHAALCFIFGAGLPGCLLFGVGGAGVSEPYPTVREYLTTALLGSVVIGPIVTITLLGVPLVLLWGAALSHRYRLAMIARVLMISPLVVTVPLICSLVLGGLAGVNHPDFGLGEPIPWWMKTPIVVWGGSDSVLLLIVLAWAGIVAVAIRHSFVSNR